MPPSDPALAAGLLNCMLFTAGLLAQLGLVVWVASHPPDLRGKALEVCRRPWTGDDLHVTVLTVLGVQALLVLVAGSAGLVLGNRLSSVAGPIFVIQILVFALAGAVLVGRLMQRRGLSWRAAFGSQSASTGKSILQGLWGYLALIPVVFAGAWFYAALLRWIGYTPQPQGIAQLLCRPDLPALQAATIAVLASTVTPVVEELLFRGIALPVLARRIGAWRAVFFVSFLFAVVHLHLPSVVPLFLVAVAFSLAYMASQSILVPIVMHGLFNAVNLLGLFMRGGAEEVSAGALTLFPH